MSLDVDIKSILIELNIAKIRTELLQRKVEIDVHYTKTPLAKDAIQKISHMMQLKIINEALNNFEDEENL